MWSWEIVQFAALCWFFPRSQGISSYSCTDEYSTETPQVPCAVPWSSLCCFLLSDILPHKFLLPLVHLTLIIFFSIHHVTGLCLDSPFLCHSLETTSRAVNGGSCRAHLCFLFFQGLWASFLLSCVWKCSFSKFVCVSGVGCWGSGYL